MGRPKKTSLGADQLRAMRGSTAVTNIGMQLEYFPLSIRDFTATIGKFRAIRKSWWSI